MRARRDGLDGPAPGRGAEVVEVGGQHLRQERRRLGIKLEIATRGEQRDVRPIIAHAEQERLVGGACQPLDGPGGDLAVAHLVVRHVERSPVERLPGGPLRVAIAGHPVQGEDGHLVTVAITNDVARVGRLGRQLLGRVIRVLGLEQRTPSLLDGGKLVEDLRGLVMQQLAGPECPIAMRAEILGQQHELGMELPDVRPIVVDARPERQPGR